MFDRVLRSLLIFLNMNIHSTDIACTEKTTSTQKHIHTHHADILRTTVRAFKTCLTLASPGMPAAPRPPSPLAPPHPSAAPVMLCPTAKPAPRSCAARSATTSNTGARSVVRRQSSLASRREVEPLCLPDPLDRPSAN
jgi:hypothetical protein